VDALFENSEAQTRTETEAAFLAGFMAMAGNLALLLNGIALAVSFTILLVTANTMSMAVRERRTEIAILKTLGFPSRLVMGLILTEALLIGALGGGLGLLLSRGMIQALPKIPFIGDAVRQFPNLGLLPDVAATGLGISLLLGLMAGLVPALLAYRARITEMLRQV
jgi:putative ABC transport system permease protein